MNKNRLLPLSALSLALLSSGLSAATYEIVPLATANKGLYSFANSIDGQGNVLLTVQNAFNPPIDVSLLDLDNNEALSNSLEAPDDVKNGVISTRDRAILYTYILQNRGNPLFQQLGNYLGYLTDAEGSEAVVGFDAYDADINGLSRSVDVLPAAINADGVAVGNSTAPFYKINYTNEADIEHTYLIRDFNRRGFVAINGLQVPLVPAETTFGGYSEARGVSDNLWVAGVSSIEKRESFDTAIENCNDDEKRGDFPIALCLSNSKPSVSSPNSQSGQPNEDTADTYLGNYATLDGAYKNRATLWKIDNQGNVLDSKTFDLPFTPKEDDTVFYANRAADVNNNGIAVGVSHASYPDYEDLIRTYAAVFYEDKTLPIGNEERYSDYTLRNNGLLSAATAINNHNQVIGYTLKLVNGFERTKFFVYDFDEQTMTYPDDFFPGSSSIARDINDAGQVVGDGEVESTIGGSVRRRNAFIYDNNDKQFQNLNDLVSCNSPYTLVQANAINESGEIAATATYKRASLDIVGEPLLDSAGNQVMEEAIVAVKLVPIPGGDIDDCSGNQDKVERQGAGFGWWLLGLLGVSGLLRRR
ncbi:DUF3466 family protein [Bowmanella pacifica]|uniref:DUF3466 family protein n=1 Tax=Bowmanella pacifica TaxID=502051 RepID=A0A917YXL1_9ALTE|nr:DUF3466 family protein [Bowmanella pacifica]GGO69515.1 hypothetical protein GCM10010982_20850 [Bowmanella pacifica]